MAYDYFSQTQSDKDKEAEEQNQGVIIGGGSPVVNAGSSAQQQPGQPSKSGAYTNLQDYLAANQDPRFGNEVVGKIKTTVDQAKTAQDEFQNQYKGQVDQSTVKKNDIVLGQVQKDASKVVADPNQTAAYTQMRDAQYKGPMTASDLADPYMNTAGKLTKAQQTASANTTEAGRKAYLDQEYGSGVGNNSYTAGQRKLDNFLIQNTPDSKAGFENLNTEAQGLTGQFDQMKKLLEQYSGSAKDTTAQTRAAARGAIGLTDNNTFADTSKATAIDKAAAARAKSVNDYRAADEAALRNAIAKKSLTPEQLARLGVGTKPYGEDLRNYLTSPGTVDKLGAMTEKESNELSALAQLAGISNPYVADADKAKVGKADLSAVAKIDAANQQKLKGTFQQKQDQYNNFMGGYTFANPSISGQLARLNIFRPPHASAYDSLNSTLDNLSGWIRANGSNGNAKFSNGPSGQIYYGTVLDVYRNLVAQRDSLASQLGINDVLNTNLQQPGTGKSGDDFAPPKPPDLSTSPVEGGGSPVKITPPEKPMTLMEWLAAGNAIGGYQNYLTGNQGNGAR